MVLGAFLSGCFFGLVALALARSLGWVTAAAAAGFAWSVVVIALVTLVPLTASTSAVPAETRPTCSLDYGGPAPEGFWIFPGGQRLLNTALFVPAGALLGGGRRPVAGRGWVAVRSAWSALAAYSLVIEAVQLEPPGSAGPATSPTWSTTSRVRCIGGLRSGWWPPWCCGRGAGRRRGRALACR